MKVRVEFEVELPDVKHTEKQLEEFLRFEHGDNGVMSGNNPFKGETAAPIFGTYEWEYEKVNDEFIFPDDLDKL